MAGDGIAEIRWWPEARVAELQAFIDAEWKPGHVLATDEDLLRWQHPRAGDELSVVAATADDRLVGILGVIPADFCVHGRRGSAAWLTTWVVVSDWRNRQIGLRLLEIVLAEHDVVGTVGGNDTTMRILGALHFHLWRSVPRWVLPLAEEGCARLVGENAARALRQAAMPSVTGVVSDWSRETDEAWDRVWRERFAPQLVGTWRDATYIRRRYVEHPRFTYRVRIAPGDDGLPAALLVHRVEAVSGADATVIRVVEALGEREPLARLVFHLVRDGRESGAAFADFYCTSDGFAAGLEQAGFVAETGLPVAFPSRFQPLDHAPRGLTAAVRSMRDQSADVFDAGDVYLTRSDGDQDRPN